MRTIGVIRAAERTEDRVPAYADVELPEGRRYDGRRAEQAAEFGQEVAVSAG